MDDTFRHVRTCDRLRPVYYAAASGDFNPVHLDDVAARSAGLPGAILHGMCTYAWLAQACSAALADPGRIRRMSARFSRPVLPGDVVTFAGRCALREHDRVLLEVNVTNQRGEEVLQSARVETVLTPLAPASSTGRRYGPYRYHAGVEKIREFRLAIAGGIPARSFGADDASPAVVPEDEPAPPTFAAAVALQPCAEALRDPENKVDMLRVLHGEEEIAIHAEVWPGDVLETSGEILRVEQKRSFRVFLLRTRTVNQRGEAVLEATSSWIAR